MQGWIPKSNGKLRLLGVSTATDRMLQQAVGQVLAIKFEMEFGDYSYGFRPNRNAQQAVLKAQEYINSGYQHIVDIDLKSFFDEVDHCILLQLLYRKVKCPLTLRLIRKWLRAPIQINGKLVKRRKGVPQGSPLTPCTHLQTLNLYGELLLKGENSFRGISRHCRITAFSGDGHGRALLKRTKSNNENALLSGLKRSGQRESLNQQSLLLEINVRCLGESHPESIAPDADSAVKSVCGKQKGTAKGCNTTKQRVKSYHPLQVFVSGMNLLYHTWFRTGSACTCERIVAFLREVKVKLKNLENLIGEQPWLPVKKGAKTSRNVSFFIWLRDGKNGVLKAMHGVKGYVQSCTPERCSYLFANMFAIQASRDAVGLRENYKQRSTIEFCDERDQYKTCYDWRVKKQNQQSETWIGQEKEHTIAGGTPTDDFWANDTLLLWQLCVSYKSGREEFDRLIEAA